MRLSSQMGSSEDFLSMEVTKTWGRGGEDASKEEDVEEVTGFVVSVQGTGGELGIRKV